MTKTVAATIIQRGDSVLLLKRGPTAPWMPGKWNFPTGGVEDDEAVVEAAIRETQEEAGLAVNYLTKVITLNMPTATVTYFHTFDSEGEPTLNYESSEYQWVPIREVSAMDVIPGVTSALEALGGATRVVAAHLWDLPSQTGPDLLECPSEPIYDDGRDAYRCPETGECGENGPGGDGPTRVVARYLEAARHTIEVDVEGDTLKAIEKVLAEIKYLGDVGHSTSIDVDGEAIAGVDGDGADRTHEILIDGKPVEREKRTAARYKNKKQVPKQDGEGTTTVYEYSEGQVQHRNREKAKRVEKLRKSIDGLRAQVAKDLKSSDPNKFLTALAVGLIDETYERVGNDTSAKDGHFGVTGWQKNHVSFGRGKATVTYVGKSGVKQKKTVSSAALVKALRDAYEAVEGEDCLFCHDTGKIDATKINAYLQKFDITAKDIRGLHANEEMKRRLKAVRKGKLPTDAKERQAVLKEEFKKALEETAAAVGHEASTLRSQYLVPGLEDTYMKDGTVMHRLDKSADRIALSPQQRGWERRRERDERAQYNIPSEYHGLWNKLKNQFKGTPDERAEQFMEYIEEHPYENDAWLQENADREIAQMERERQKQIRLERKCETGQDKYEDAWYKEQERATKEKRRLKQLKERADDVCQACPTCKVTPDEDYEPVPFAASLVNRVVARYATELVQIDQPWVDKMRADFLTLMKNVPRVKDYDTAIRLKEAFNVWGKRFADLMFERFLNKSLKYDERIKENVRKNIDYMLRKSGWDFYIEADLPIDRATDFMPETVRFSRYQQDVKAWEKRIRRKAQVFWKAVREAIDYYEDPNNRRYKDPDEPATLQAEVPGREQVILEGFRIEVRGYKQNDRYNAEEMAMLKEALKLFRKRSAERMPWMAKNQLPMIFEFEATIGEGGRYNHDGTITIYASAAVSSNPDKLVKTMAHEMGHHLWKLLGGGAKDYWSEAIYGDYGDLDIRELLAKWPGDMWSYEFAEYLADKDPVLSLQLDAVWPGYAGRHRELAKKQDFEDLLEEGTTTMPTPNNPITGYANKNSEEAFCEAVGMLVAYGPRTVLPQIRKWLNVTIPGEIRMARVIARYLANRGQR